MAEENVSSIDYLLMDYQRKRRLRNKFKIGKELEFCKKMMRRYNKHYMDVARDLQINFSTIVSFFTGSLGEEKNERIIEYFRNLNKTCKNGMLICTECGKPFFRKNLQGPVPNVCYEDKCRKARRKRWNRTAYEKLKDVYWKEEAEHEND